jgi:hypothetical protein
MSGIQRTTTVTRNASLTWRLAVLQLERIPRICLIRMSPLVQVQPGPQTGFDLPKRSSVASFDRGRSRDSPAQRSQNASMSAEGVGGDPVDLDDDVGRKVGPAGGRSEGVG